LVFLSILKNTFYWSNEFLQLFGLPENTIAGFEAWTKALHPDDIERASTKIQEAIENRTELLNDYRIILPNSEIRWIRATGHTTYLNDKPIRMIGLCMDITDQKTAEQELYHAKERAEESELNLRLINNQFKRSNQLLEASQSIAKLGGWELDLLTNQLYWTTETFNIHDTTPEEFNPTVDAGVSYFLPESKQTIIEALELAKTKGTGYDLILETYTTKGRKIDVRTTCQVALVDGKPVKLTGIFQDITELSLSRWQNTWPKSWIRNTFASTSSKAMDFSHKRLPFITKVNLIQTFPMRSNKRLAAMW